MTEHRLVSLVTRQFIEDLEPTESAELNEWAAESDTNRHFLETFTDPDRLIKELSRIRKADSARGYAKLEILMRTERRSRLVLLTGAWAAVIVFVIAGIVLIKCLSLHGIADVAKTQVRVPVPPGKDTVLLTRYAATGYNVLTTPRSGEHQVTLPDSSHVWLNDSSSIRYSAVFQGRNRTVDLCGEAYFEIVPDTTRPFIVKLRNATVEAKGTSFDVSSYPGEDASSIVLVKGTVQVRTARDSTWLLPNEEALVKANGGLGVTKGVPASALVSWRDGFFFFDQTPLDEVLRQLARWYDIDVVNLSNRSDIPWSAKFNRRVPLDSLIKELDKMHNEIKFHLENRRLIVLPN